MQEFERFKDLYIDQCICFLFMDAKISLLIHKHQDENYKSYMDPAIEQYIFDYIDTENCFDDDIIDDYLSSPSLRDFATNYLSLDCDQAQCLIDLMNDLDYLLVGFCSEFPRLNKDVVIIDQALVKRAEQHKESIAKWFIPATLENTNEQIKHWVEVEKNSNF